MLATAGLTRSTMSANEAGARPGIWMPALSGFNCAWTADCGSPSPTTPANARPAKADAYARRRVLLGDRLWLGSERSMRFDLACVRVTLVCLYRPDIGAAALRRPFGLIKSW